MKALPLESETILSTPRGDSRGREPIPEVDALLEMLEVLSLMWC